MLLWRERKAWKKIWMSDASTRCSQLLRGVRDLVTKPCHEICPVEMDSALFSWHIYDVLRSAPLVSLLGGNRTVIKMADELARVFLRWKNDGGHGKAMGRGGEKRKKILSSGRRTLPRFKQLIKNVKCTRNGWWIIWVIRTITILWW